MEELVFKKVNETVYKETLDNGLEIYYYPNKLTKMFSMSINVKYGAKVTKYKKNGKTYNITPGVAHFLEHRVMDTTDKSISSLLEKYGTYPNACTNYYGTKYYLYGSGNIAENLELLLKIFFKRNINKDTVENEKGIICEEIDMGEDNNDRKLFREQNRALFNNSYIINTVVGTHDDINSITEKELNRIYDDFYIPNNMFISVCGNFDYCDISEILKGYLKKYKLKRGELPKVIESKEDEKVKVKYTEINRKINSDKVSIGYKMKRSNFGEIDDNKLSMILNLIMKCNFSPTTSIYEEYKTKGLMLGMSAYSSIIDDYVVLRIISNTVCAKKFIKRVQEDINCLNIDEDELNRKTKLYVKSIIMDFENVEDVDNVISSELFEYNMIHLDDYDTVTNLKFSDYEKVFNKINLDNCSVAVITK